MKFTEYLIDVQRTWNKQSPELDEQHYTLGLIDELGELASAFKKHIGYGKEIDKINVLEECGDLLYFLCMQSIEFKEDMDMIGYVLFDGGKIDKETEFGIKDLYEDLDKESLYKRFHYLISCIYKAVMKDDDKINGLFLSTILTIKSILNDFGYTLQDCMERNVAKREARFPKGYEQTKAIDRDLGNERQILEA